MKTKLVRFTKTKKFSFLFVLLTTLFFFFASKGNIFATVFVAATSWAAVEDALTTHVSNDKIIVASLAFIAWMVSFVIYDMDSFVVASVFITILMVTIVSSKYIVNKALMGDADWIYIMAIPLFYLGLSPVGFIVLGISGVLFFMLFREIETPFLPAILLTMLVSPFAANLMELI